MREVLAWLIFPVCVGGVIGGGFVALDAGVEPGTVTGVGTLVSILLAASLERIQPYRPEWNRSRGDLLTDFLYIPTFLGVNALIEPAARVCAVLIGGALSERFGIGLWPGDWPLFLQFVLACVVVEGFDYWPHRLLHEVPWLWRFHAVHHNPKRLYWMNATRSHPVEIAFRGFVNVIPLAMLGADVSVLALVALANSILGMFQHANIDCRLGPLTWIFSVGEMHRWHHAVELEKANHNYGSNFLFWDVVFGTRYRDPVLDGPEVIGIEHDDLPDEWWKQLGAAFKPRGGTPDA